MKYFDDGHQRMGVKRARRVSYRVWLNRYSAFHPFLLQYGAKGEALQGIWEEHRKARKAISSGMLPQHEEGSPIAQMGWEGYVKRQEKYMSDLIDLVISLNSEVVTKGKGLCL